MKKLNERKFTIAGWLLFYLYMILLCYFLFFSERYGRAFETEEFRYNLEFLKEIKRFIRYRKLLGLEIFVVNIMGNVLAFAPFGFLLPMLSKHYRRFLSVAILSLMFSLSVELIQLFFRVGIFDVDDIFLNTMGGILGYVCYAIYHLFDKLVHRHRKKN